MSDRFGAEKHKQNQPIEDQLLKWKEDTTAIINQDTTLEGNERTAQLEELTHRYQRLFHSYVAKWQELVLAEGEEDTARQQLEAVHQSGLSLDERRSKARQAAAAISEKTISAIIADPSLTDNDKTKQIGQVNDAQAAANLAITAAPTIDKIKAAQNSQITSIQTQHQSADLAARQAAAQKDIDTWRFQTKDLIQKEATLNDRQKNDQIADVDRAWMAVNELINREHVRAQEIVDAVASSQADIQSAFQQGDKLDRQRLDCQGKLQHEYGKLLYAIQADKNLTEDEQSRMQTALAQVLQNAENGLAKDKNAQAILDDFGRYLQDIEQVHGLAKSTLKARQEEAKEQLDLWQADTLAAIQNDTTLDADQKRTQEQTLANMYNQLLGEIDTLNASSQTVLNVMKGAPESD
ncbi:hypothetical protein LNP00_02195 [Fructobacillus sp. M158]|uniref:hypothetical protein n=1 Tax=Fructobacillus parabroussonetiae TaxID=2713174 RepID=UPI00200AE9D9|nr:hypothetical protein [Fructobacillus parabroussonetiae]MCK8617180.1 hypothetical protein [Fructobacillus parabroussonetiae]